MILLSSKNRITGKEGKMVVTEIQPTKKNNEKIRLAAYCRVSSDSSDQMNSFVAQIKYYTDYSKVHTEYELVDIYAEM